MRRLLRYSYVLHSWRLLCQVASTKLWFVATNLLSQLAIHAMLYVEPPSTVATIVNRFAKSAMQEAKMAMPWKQSTVPARPFVVGRTPPAVINAPRSAMGISRVDYVQKYARFVAVILNAARNVTSLVCLALKTALGSAHTRGPANCPVQCLVTYFHALSAAL